MDLLHLLLLPFFASHQILQYLFELKEYNIVSISTCSQTGATEKSLVRLMVSVEILPHTDLHLDRCFIASTI